MILEYMLWSKEEYHKNERYSNVNAVHVAPKAYFAPLDDAAG